MLISPHDLAFPSAATITVGSASSSYSPLCAGSLSVSTEGVIYTTLGGRDVDGDGVGVGDGDGERVCEGAVDMSMGVECEGTAQGERIDRSTKLLHNTFSVLKYKLLQQRI